MQIIRFADLCAQGQARGKRVFIRADLNVPFDEHGHISEDTRIRASVPAIQMALDAGAAVMVTSHLGRPTEGAFKPEDSLAPVAKRLAELLGRDVPLVADWVGGVSVAAGQVVMLEKLSGQYRRKEKQRIAGQTNGGVVRHLCERRIWHRTPRRGNDLRHRAVRCHRLCRTFAVR